MKLKPLVSLAAAVLAVLALLAASCGEDTDNAGSTTAAPAANSNSNSDSGSGSPRTAPTEPFKLGAILPQTGDLSIIVNALVNGSQLAVDEINDAGIQTIDYVQLDSGTNPEIANNAADEHIANSVHGIFGAGASGISLSIIDKVVGSGTVMIAASNTSPTFTDYPDNGLYFRTTPSDVLKSQVLGRLIIDQGGQDVAILHRADDYGQALAREAQAALEADGASVVLNESFDPAGTTFMAEVQKVADSGADSVMLIAFDEGHAILRQMIEAGFGPDEIDIFLPDVLATPTLGEDINPADPSVVAGIFGINPGVHPSSEATFNERYQALNPGLVEQWAPQAFDAVTVLALAALAAESNDPSDYAAHVVGVTRDGTKCSLYAECAQLLLDGENIDYDGASGPLEFTDVGEPTNGTFRILQYNDSGTYDVLETESVDLAG